MSVSLSGSCRFYCFSILCIPRTIKRFTRKVSLPCPYLLIQGSRQTHYMKTIILLLCFCLLLSTPCFLDALFMCTFIVFPFCCCPDSNLGSHKKRTSRWSSLSSFKQQETWWRAWSNGKGRQWSWWWREGTRLCSRNNRIKGAFRLQEGEL